MPQVSLIMTIYNRANYLKEALNSIIAQTYSHFELLSLDDGSTDSSRIIAQDYAQQDNRFRVISSTHQGRVKALIQAHQNAKGEYLAWLDSDDILAPTALQETVDILERFPNIGLVYTNYFVIDAASRLLDIGSRCRIPYSKEQLLVNFMTFHFRLIRRSAFEQAGGIDPYFVGVAARRVAAIDYDLCLRLSEVTVDACVLS